MLRMPWRSVITPVVTGALLALSVVQNPLWAFGQVPQTLSQDFGPPTPPVDETSYAVKCDRRAPKGFDRYIREAASEFHINPKVIATTVYRESDCNPRATGGAGERGLGQIRPSGWVPLLRKHGIVRHADDLYDPRKNLRATAFILDRIRDGTKGGAQEVFTRYNGRGPQARKYASEQVATHRRLWGEFPTL